MRLLLALLLGQAAAQSAGSLAAAWPPSGGLRGGTTVSLFGDDWTPEDDVVCLFGAAVVPAVLVLTSWAGSAQCTSPPGLPGFVSLHLSLNGGADVGDEVLTEFLYTELVDVRLVAPLLGDSRGGALVRLEGRNFAADAACAWQGTPNPRATDTVTAFASSALLHCETPFLPSGAATVRATRWGEASEGSASFITAPAMLSLSSAPGAVTAAGGTHVTLAGRGYRESDDAGCAFGPLLVAAAVLTSQRAACLAPAQAPSAGVALRVRVQALSDVGAVSIAVLEDPGELQVQAEVAPAGLLATVFGAGIAPLPAPRCALGEWEGTLLRAAFPGSLLCLLPVLPVAGFVTLTLSDTALPQALDAGALRALAWPRLLTSFPAAGDASGGALLWLVGTGFDAGSDAAFCALAETRGPAFVVSSALMACEAPRARPGPLPVALGGIATAPSHPAGALFWGMGSPLPLALTPSFGGSEGGTSVSVGGVSLADADAACWLGTLGPLQALAAVADGARVCVTPAALPGARPLVIGLNAQQRSLQDGALLFSHLIPPLALGASPPVAPLRGESDTQPPSVKVLLEWTDAVAPTFQELLCDFGGAHTAVLALDLAPLTVHCLLPPGILRFVPLALLLPGAAISSASLDFLFYTPPFLRAVLPRKACKTGGTVLSVLGAHFPGEPGDTACSINADGVSAVTVGVAVSSALLRCDTSGASATAEELATLTVRRLGSQAPSMTDGLALTLAPVPVVSSVQPLVGASEGGTALQLGGSSLAGVDAAWLGTLGPLATRPAGMGVLFVAPAHAPAAVPAALGWRGELPFGATAGSFAFAGVPAVLADAPAPAAVPLAGGAFITLPLSDTPAEGALQLLFGPGIAVPLLPTPGRLLTAGPLPPGQGGYTPLSLAWSGSTSVAAGQLLVCAAPRLSALAPRVAAAEGGTLLRFLGASFSAGLLQVAFNAAAPPSAAPLAFVSSALALGEAPPAPAGVEAAPTRLALPGAAAGASGLAEQELSYAPLCDVTAAAPADLYEAGGMLVTLIGSHLAGGSAARCRFGPVAVAVSGSEAGGNSAFCVAPAGSPALHLEVAAHAHTASDARFGPSLRPRVLPQPRSWVAAAQPSCAASPFTLTAWAPSPPPAFGVPQLRCRFGLSEVPAFAGGPLTPDGLRPFRCDAPPSPAGFVAVTLAPPGGNVTSFGGPGAEAPQFLFPQPATPLRAWPARGRARGGTLVALRAQHLGGCGAEAQLLVQFGEGGPLAPARFVSSALLTAVAPPELEGTGDTPSDTLDAAALAHLAEWSFAPSPALLAASPALGSVAGGTDVLLSGHSFAPGEPHFCRFGTIGPVAAAVVSEEAVRCTSPAHVTGAPVPLAVALANTRDFEAALLFEY